MLSKNVAHIDKNRCVSCGECYNNCPRGAISIVYGCFAEADFEKCVGCGLCSKICPAGCIKIGKRGECNE